MTTLREVAAAFQPVGLCQLTAWMQCIEESGRFAYELWAAGLNTATDFRPVSGWSEEFGIGHVAILDAEGNVWDWTARQFWHDAPVPMVVPLAAWRRHFAEDDLPDDEVWSWFFDHCACWIEARPEDCASG